MTLTELKNKVIAKLKELTIDDYYFDPNLTYIKSKFKKEFGGDSDEKIKEYLISRFPETFENGIEIIRKEELNDLRGKMEQFDLNSQNLKDKIASNRKKREQQESRENELILEDEGLKADCEKFNKEIDVLIKLEGDSKYDIQIKELKGAINEKKTRIEQLPQLILDNKLLLETLDNELLSLEKQLLEVNLEKETVQKTYDKILFPFGKPGILSNKHYKDEEEAIDILCRLLLRGKIGFDERKKIIFGKYGQLSKNVLFFNDITHEREVYNKSAQEYSNYIKRFYKVETILPDEWNSLLINILESPIPPFEGLLYFNLNGNRGRTYREGIINGRYYASPLLLSCLLSLRIGLYKNLFIQSQDNTILLYLSGGVSASITFSPVSRLVQMERKDAPNFYLIVENTENGVGYLDLFHQDGIADSEIQIPISEGFYIVYKDYVIIIRFESTPILIESNTLGTMIPNNGPLVKKWAEEAEQKRKEEEEEERQRQMDDDDY
jgi:hypothetical protein